ncbi:MAG: hypothetical protein MCM46_02590 [Candidatus Manganitrophus sp. SB1]|nr:hypothetical protein [Candidatus Manganitrophus morganii]
MHQLSNVGAALAHFRKPRPGNEAQLGGLFGQPGVDRRISLDGSRKSK